MSVTSGTIFNQSSGYSRFPHANNKAPLFLSDNKGNVTTITEQKEDTVEKRKLDRILVSSDVHLAHCKAVFPFDFFPDEITVDQHKVNVISREFFFSEDIHSILIKDIKDVELESSLFFSKLKIVPDGYPTAPVCIQFLKKKDALVMREIIQGLRVVQKEGIDVAKIDADDLKQKTGEIGKAL